MPYRLDTNVTGSHWDNDYRARHQNNYELIEDALNRFESALGLTGYDENEVPQGLREIFDRKGIIGIGSYDFDEGTLSGPNYYLTVSAGGYWTGSDYRYKRSSTNISLAALDTGTYYVNVDASGTPSVSATPDSDSTTRQFYWNSTTKTVSDKALYSGVAILFDGDDYADMLTSAVKSKSYTRVADRLEEIEQGQDVFAGYYAQNLPHSGLNFKFKAGKVRNDSTITDTSAGQVTLTNNATNYVEVDPSTGTVSANTTGFTSGKIPLYVVVTSGGAIVGVTDQRTAAIAGTGGGGGGGHTQNTDTGTTASSFVLDMDATGAPTGRVKLEVENGNNPNAIFAWNRDLGRFEISTDGGQNYYPLPTLENLFDQLEMTKLVMLELPQQAYYETNRGSSEDWEVLDLSAYLTEAPNGAAAVSLIVMLADTNPFSCGIMFRPGGSTADHTLYYREASGTTNQNPSYKQMQVPVSDDGELEFFLQASGSSSATLLIIITGYFAKVTGIGTQPRTFSATGLQVNAGTTGQFNLTGFLNRGEAHYFKITETGGQVSGLYDVAIYAKDTFNPGTDDENLLYKAEDISPTTPFIDRLPFWLRDDDGTRELHLEITNRDTSQAGTYSVTIKAEQFA